MKNIFYHNYLSVAHSSSQISNPMLVSFVVITASPIGTVFYIIPICYIFVLIWKSLKKCDISRIRTTDFKSIYEKIDNRHDYLVSFFVNLLNSILYKTRQLIIFRLTKLLPRRKVSGFSIITTITKKQFWSN